MEEIIFTIRDLIEDNLKSNASAPDSFEFISSKVFTLTESKVDASSIKCYKNQVLWNGANYSYDATTNKVTVDEESGEDLVAGNILDFIYNYYAKYSDNELRGYIRAALTYLVIEKYKVFAAKDDNIVFPTPTKAEVNLIALIASIIIKPPITSYKTSEITIVFPEKLSKEEKIKMAIRQFSKTFGLLKYIDPDEEAHENGYF
jgi:hypothetical protein